MANDEKALASLQEMARGRGGECLSPKYLGSLVKHRWRCAAGHEWDTTPSVVRRGMWCPKCAGVARLSREDLHAAARAKGGECISPEYMGVRTKHRWRCAVGHEWEATPDTVRHGTWCRQCLIWDLDDLRSFASARGGECISPDYHGMQSHYRWRCAVGHEWEARADTVVRGFWCHQCAGRPKVTLADLKAAASARGGECLGQEYLGVMSRYRWRCAAGHEWNAIADSVRRGSWCPVCAGRRPRD